MSDKKKQYIIEMMKNQIVKNNEELLMIKRKEFFNANVGRSMSPNILIIPEGYQLETKV